MMTRSENKLKKLRICAAKVEYHSKSSADESAKECRTMKLYSYKCIECKKWHLTSH